MPNVMAALPNIGGALCSTPQSFADVIAHTCKQPPQAVISMAGYG